MNTSHHHHVALAIVGDELPCDIAPDSTDDGGLSNALHLKLARVPNSGP